jgi:pyridoxamine 5'-phosphate oxidase
MNQKNSLGLNNCFLDKNDPIDLFEVWMNEAIKTEPNDPNAVSLGTSDQNNSPSVRMVLLKDFNKDGFIFYTNLDSQKGNELKNNPKAAMCFHWKSLLRQVRINGVVQKVSNEVADEYYNTRSYESRIGAWASKQSSILNNRDELLNSIEKYKKKYNNKKEIPRPDHWSGWNLIPTSIEFWLDGNSRIHERLKYIKDDKDSWTKSLLSP